MLRRNGKPSSCEPCRRSKLKCDNGSPICQRCERRNIKDKCYYHPAPLTQIRHTADKPKTPLRNLRPSIPTLDRCPVSRSVPKDHLGSPSSSDRAFGHPTPLSQDWSSSTQTNVVEHLSVADCVVGADIIYHLESVSVFEEMSQEYWSFNNPSSIIGPIMLNILASTRSFLEKELKYKSRHQVAAEVTRNTRKPVEIPSTIKATDFHLLFTGENLRWETIGLIFAMTGFITYMLPVKTCAVIIEKYPFPESASFVEFSAAMSIVTNQCLTLWHECGSSNDVSLWLVYIDYLHLTNLHGDAHALSWRRNGDVATEVYALGLHQDFSEHSIPFFLKESRKRLLAAAYKSDKILAGFLNKPPRLTRHYCTIHPPLELSNEEVMMEGPELEAAISGLDEHGWNTTGEVHATSWQRVRVKMSFFREELLEMSFLPSTQDTLARLRILEESLVSTWDNVPSKLHYRPSCWESTHWKTCVALHFTELDYLDCAFRVRRLIAQQSPAGQNNSLRASIDLLSHLLDFVKQTQTVDDWEINRDLPAFLLYFGLPAAGVLVSELRSRVYSRSTLPAFISRAEVVRHLCVLVAALDWMNTPRTRYQELCSTASKKLGEEVDEIINLSICPDKAVPKANDELSMGGIEPSGLDQTSGPPLEDLHTDETFLRWLDGVDWNTTTLSF